MKKISVLPRTGYISFSLAILLMIAGQPTTAQSCPSGTTTITSYPNTYYPASQATVTAGTRSITLGAVTNGSSPIQFGDVLLLIQMQGASYSSSNSNVYGDGSGSGSGYNTAGLVAGNMEYIVAGGSLPLTGGTLNLLYPLVNSYSNVASGVDGQKSTYQVIRVPVYYDLQLNANITAPAWDGYSGGVLVLYASHNINLNSMTVDASGKGFRGGGGRQLSGGGGSSSDYRRYSSSNFDGSKGEGISGTPKYVNYNNTLTNTGSYEGYNSGSLGMGAPGNAGGGGTDGNPASNNQNTGGGGGGNGGPGGKGGNAWSSGTTSGGNGGATFAQATASRMVMGGGGGAGTSNDGTGTPGSGFASSGSAGGGIVIVWAANQINGTGSILANGADGNTTVQNDGAGGAGAGGSILIYSTVAGANTITAQAYGGNGGSNEQSGGSNHGPGGGGGGGNIFGNVPLTAPSAVNGGNAGTTVNNFTYYGATAGTRGSSTTSLSSSALPAFPVACQTLGVTFLNVTAQLTSGNVNLRWEVAREINTTSYMVEKSTDGTNFTTIATIPYKEGDALDNVYQYTDEETSSGGKILYRIRELDSDGKELYSKTVAVQLGSLTGKLSVYPNPAQNTATLSYTLTTGTNISLRLFDLNGRELWTKQVEGYAGTNTVAIDCVRTLPEGAYILQWFDNLQPQQVKLIVRH